MLFIKGWRPLGEVTRAVRLRRWREIAESAGEGSDTFEAKQLAEHEIAAEVWEICRTAPRIGVLLTNGRVVEAAPDVVSPDNEYDESNIYLNLTMGTLGSSFYRFRREEEEQAPAARPVGFLEYEPFVGLPVLLPEACLVQAKQGPQTLIAQDREATSPGSTAGLARSIVAMYDQGLPVTKKTCREVLAPDHSFRAFGAAWRIAVDLRPALAKPGRRASEIETP